jgi:hypothetical protein
VAYLCFSWPNYCETDSLLEKGTVRPPGALYPFSLGGQVCHGRSIEHRASELKPTLNAIIRGELSSRSSRARRQGTIPVPLEDSY